MRQDKPESEQERLARRTNDYLDIAESIACGELIGFIVAVAIILWVIFFS